jgi:hypothetical protein
VRQAWETHGDTHSAQFPTTPQIACEQKTHIYIYIYIYAIHMYTYICLSLYIYIILYVWHVCVLCGMSIYMYICIYLCIYIYHTIWSWRHLATCCPMSCMEEARARHMFPNTASQKRPGGEAGPTTHVKDPGMKRSLPLCSCFGDNDLTRASSPVRCGIYIYIYKLALLCRCEAERTTAQAISSRLLLQ